MSHGRFDSPITASLTGLLDLFRPQPLSGNLKETDRFDNKTIIITGANSGLGFAMTKEIARRGGNVIMACRSEIPAAGERAARQSGCSSISMMNLDLSRIESIHAFVAALKTRQIRIDVLILNAATTLPEARRTECGLDEMFLVNYLSNFILVNLLLDQGVLVADVENPQRLVVISSDSHQSSSAIEFEEFGVFFNYGVSKAINNYSYFKLVLNTFATELSRRINTKNVALSVNLICPGPVNTNIIKEAPLLLRIILRAIFTLIFKSPDKAALAPVYLAVSPEFEGSTNQYLHMFNHKRMDEKVYDPGEGKKLWQASFELWQKIDARSPA
jgi:NAD(P)-dependent dehydrogenase (short-subunit alcohol dehydrogenase family)